MLKTNYISILKIALPMMVGMFIQSVVMITDAAILNRYDILNNLSSLSFDASGNAGLIYVTLFMGMSGLGDGAQILISNRIGEKRINAIKHLIPSSIFSNLFLALLFFSLVQFLIPSMLFSYSSDLNLAQKQVDFISIRSIGFFVASLMITFNAFFLAIGKTWIILVSALIFAASNITLDIILVFGIEGSIPSLGLEGAAIASNIAEGTAVIFLFIMMLRVDERKKFEIFSTLRIKKETLTSLWKVGSPLLFQGFLALATWTVFFTFIEQRSRYDLTVSQNIRFIYMIAFVPIFGFAATTKTYVSHFMGAKDFKQIKKVQYRILLLSALFVILLFHGTLFYPETLINLVNPDKTYLNDSAAILRMVFGSIFMFALFTPFFQTINGSGNTRATLIIEISSILIYLVFAFLFIKVFELHIYNVWFVEYIYFGVMGVLSLIYLKFFNWQKKII